jgi:hypothetical protein
MSRSQPAERNARYRKRRRGGLAPVVSEGDSWFDYPFFRNMIDHIDDAELFAHMRLETSGDTVDNMIGKPSSLKNLQIVVEDVRPVCVLFSGGGNDMADAADGLFQNPGTTDPEDYLIPKATKDLFDGMTDAYEAMIETIGPTAPVFAHGYDYFAPSPEEVRFIGVGISVGPWIFPAMMDAGIGDGKLQRDIAAVLIDRFNDMLIELQKRHQDDFIYVDLRNTLSITKDWENEIHPTRDGFKKVADKFRKGVAKALPDLVHERTRKALIVTP